MGYIRGRGGQGLLWFKMNVSKLVVITCNTSWGIVNYRSTLIKSIQNMGYSVVTIAPNDTYSTKLEALGCIHINFDIDSNSRNPIKDLLTLLNYLKLYKKLQPDVVLNYTAKPNIYSTLACSLFGLSSISNISGLGSGFIKETVVTKLLKFLYKIALKKASFIFLQNPDDYHFFKDLKIIKDSNSQILPGSGVNIDRFAKVQIPHKNNGNFVFLLVSRMMFSKGIRTLFNAGQKLYSKGHTNFQIHLLGNQEINNQDAIPNSVLQDWCREPFINYLGKTDDVVPYFEKAHCVILPSYYKEGTPRSLLEGLAVGRPIITTDTAGCKETVTDGINGFVIPPRNADMLSDRMEAMLTMSQEELQKMGDASREKAVSKFNEEIVIDAYLKKINQIVGLNFSLLLDLSASSFT